MSTTDVQLQLTVVEQGADPERLDDLTRRLMRDLQDLGTEYVERPTEEPTPEGGKGAAFTLGALALVAVPAFLPKLIEFLQAWTLRGEDRVIKIKTPAGLEVEFTPEKQLSQDEVIALAERLIQVPSE
jgi:hypothetical protein